MGKCLAEVLGSVVQNNHKILSFGLLEHKKIFTITADSSVRSLYYHFLVTTSGYQVGGVASF